jgi:putative transposase
MTICVVKCALKPGADHNPQPALWTRKASKWRLKMAPQAGQRGCDAGKQTTGRKRHVLLDTLGLMWLLVVHPANLQDRDGAKLLLAALAVFCRRLRLIWAHGAYGGALIEWVAALRLRATVRLEIVKREDGAKGWQVLPKRWIVERTFGWLSRSRRLGRDYEVCMAHSEAMIYIAMSHLMLRRLHNSGAF